MEKIGWESIPVDSNFLYSKLLFWGKKIGKIPRFNPKLEVSKLHEYSKKGYLFLKIEPNFTVTGDTLHYLKSHFTSDRWSLAPTKTSLIHLQPSIEELLMNLEKDTRYNVRLSERKGVKVREEADLKHFLPLYRETGQRGGFWIGDHQELEARWSVFAKAGKAKLFVAHQGKLALAAALVFYWEGRAYYLHAASSSSHRELMAPYLLLWEIIKASKKAGYETLDLEGLNDPRIPSTRRWQGFSLFKRGFGGTELTSPGSFSQIYNPILKIIFRIGNNF